MNHRPTLQTLLPWLFSVAIVVAMLGLLLWQNWPQPNTSGLLEPTLNATAERPHSALDVALLEQRLRAQANQVGTLLEESRVLRDQLAALMEANESTRHQSDEDIAQTAAEIASLRQTMDSQFATQAAVSENLANTLAAQNAQLQSLQQLTAQLARSNLSNGRLLGAVLALRYQVENGLPLNETLQQLENSADDNVSLRAALQNVLPYRDGVQGKLALLLQVPNVINDVLSARTIPQDDDGWINQTLASLRGIVKIRNLNAPSTSSDGRLNSASASANRGDLAGALTALQQLPDDEKRLIRPWLEATAAHLAAASAAANLEAAMVQTIAMGN